MKLKKAFLITLLFMLILVFPSAAQEIKLGTTAPPGTPWEFALKELSSRWSELSNGRYRLRLYMGGVAGSEEDMIRKIRIGQLNALIVTQSGLSTISPDMLALTLPLFVRDDAELEYLLEKMDPTFNSILEGRGFKAIAWQRAGWLHLFTKRPVSSPADLRTHKLALPIYDLSFQQIWRSMGFNIISITSNEFLTGLQTGMVDAIVSAPMLAAAYQWFPLAPNMNESAFTPLVGALVIDTRVWNRIPANIQQEMIQAAVEVLTPLQNQTLALEQEAVNIMRGMNLRVIQVPGGVRQEWINLCTEGYGSIICTTISRDLYQEMENTLIEFRKSNSR